MTMINLQKHYTINLLIGKQNKFAYLYLLTFDSYCTMHVYLTKKIIHFGCGYYTWPHIFVYIQNSRKTNTLFYTQTDCGCNEKFYSWQALSIWYFVLFFLFLSTDIRTGVTSDHHKEALEEFEDTTRVIENIKSKKDRHHHGPQKKGERTSND